MKKELPPQVINNSVATYIAGGIFVQVAEGLATEFQQSTTKEQKYAKNKLLDAVKVVEKIVRPIKSLLTENQKLIASEEVVRLVDLVSDVSSLTPEEFKRLNNILTKIKDERFKKTFSNT